MESDQDQHDVFIDEDIETFRTSHESDEHWGLRKEFLMAHRNNISKEQLICYSMVYCNMRILGCSYQNSLMKKINKLARGLGTGFHSGRKEEEKLCKELAKLAENKEPLNHPTSSQAKKPNKKKRGKKKKQQQPLPDTPTSGQPESQPKKEVAAVQNPENQKKNETSKTTEGDHKKVDSPNLTENKESATKNKTGKDRKLANKKNQKESCENKENKEEAKVQENGKMI